MRLRRDALTAAAEMALMIEARARSEADLVATVGRFDVWPDATNVIPGHVQFSIDIRSPDDKRRAAAVIDVEARIAGIAAQRWVSVSIAKSHDADAFACDPGVIAGLKKAVEAVGVPARPLQGRGEPQSAGIDQPRGLRARTCGADPVGARFQGS
jgi:allantoate deiminase